MKCFATLCALTGLAFFQVGCAPEDTTTPVVTPGDTTPGTPAPMHGDGGSMTTPAHDMPPAADGPAPIATDADTAE